MAEPLETRSDQTEKLSDFDKIALEADILCAMIDILAENDDALAYLNREQNEPLYAAHVIRWVEAKREHHKKLKLNEKQFVKEYLAKNYDLKQ